MDAEVEMLSASIMSLTFSIARVEYVTLWLVVGTGPLGSSNGSSSEGAETTSIAEPSSTRSDPGVDGGDGAVVVVGSSDVALTPLMETTGTSLDKFAFGAAPSSGGVGGWFRGAAFVESNDSRDLLGPS